MNQAVLVGQSRYGEMVVRVNGHRVFIENYHIRGGFVIPERIPKFNPLLKKLSNDLLDLVVSFLPVAEQFHAQFFFETFDCPDALLYLDFHGRIMPDPRESNIVTYAAKLAELVPPHNVVSIDISDGAVSIDSGMHLEFWLKFTIPEEMLPRQDVKRRSTQPTTMGRKLLKPSGPATS
jgi:hypothetical protein